MSIGDDVNRPLDKIENTWLRRSATLLLGFIVIPPAIVFLAFAGGFVDAVQAIYESFRHDWPEFMSECWRGPNKEE